MKRIGSIFLFFVGLTLAGVTHLHAAQDAGKTKDSKSAPEKSGAAKSRSPVPASPQSYISDQIVGLFKPKSGKELMEEKRKKPKEVPSAPDVSGVPAVGGAPSSVKIAGTSMGKAVAIAKTAAKPAASRVAVPPPPPAKVTPQVSQVRREVQKILDLNKQVKTVQSGRVGQFQRIQEQARIHQKILEQLEPKMAAAKTPKLPGKEDLLSQEKLRVIHEETQRNQAELEEMTGQAPPKTGAGEKAQNDFVPIFEEDAPTATR